MTLESIFLKWTEDKELWRIKIYLPVDFTLLKVDHDMKRTGLEFQTLCIIQNGRPEFELNPICVSAVSNSQISVANADVPRKPACIILSCVFFVFLFHRSNRAGGSIARLQCEFQLIVFT
jgi:hypothetical protein